MAQFKNDEGRPITRNDVARHAEVSTAVVSYVLTGARPVGAEREARVRAAIEELGYRPNLRARALKTGRSDTLGVVLTDITNPYFGELALEIELAAAERGRAVLIVNSAQRLEREFSLAQDLIERGVDGLIVGSNRLSLSSARLLQAGKPIVWIDDIDGTAEVMSVGPALERGTEQLVEHLVQVHGRRRVGLLLGGNDRDGLDARERGWRRALQRAGLEPGPRIECPWTRDGGAAGARRMLDAEAPPDAVVACSDLIGVGVLRAAADLGAAVPQDLSVVSIDGTEESDYTTPRLTTYRQPVVEMARAAVAAVLDPDPVRGRLEFAGELIVRESCGCGR